MWGVGGQRTPNTEAKKRPQFYRVTDIIGYTHIDVHIEHTFSTLDVFNVCAIHFQYIYILRV